MWNFSTQKCPKNAHFAAEMNICTQNFVKFCLKPLIYPSEKKIFWRNEFDKNVKGICQDLFLIFRLLKICHL